MAILAKNMLVLLAFITLGFSKAGFSAPTPLTPKLINPAINQAINQLKKPAFTDALIKTNLQPERQLVISYFSPKTCINKGDKVTFTGAYFGNKKGKSLAIVGTGLHIDVTASKWTDKSIIAVIPHDSRLKQSGSYQIGIENNTHQKWLASLQYIRLCAPANKVKILTATYEAPKVQTLAATLDAPSDNATTNPQNNQNNNNASKPTPIAAPIITAAPPSKPTPNSLNYANRVGSLLDAGQPPPPRVLRLHNTKNIKKNQPSYEPNELIIVSTNMDDAITTQQALSANGIRIKRRQKLSNLGLVVSTLRIPGGAQAEKILSELQNQQPNLWVTFNTRYQLQSAKNHLTAMKMVGWKAADKSCSNSALANNKHTGNIRIGLIDTLIDVSHPALKEQNIVQKSMINRTAKPANANHGSAIAGLLVGSSQTPANVGLLPNATLIAANVFRKRGNTIDTTAETLIYALDWLLGQNIDAINMSLGGPENIILTLAIESTLAKGVPVISSAGNGSNNAPPYPAAQPGVIGVTAIDSRQQLFTDATTGKQVDFAAPGVDLWVSLSGQKNGYRSGTSYATPFVTAALLIAKQQRPNTLPLKTLQTNAVDLGKKGKDKQFGWGLVKISDNCQPKVEMSLFLQS